MKQLRIEPHSKDDILRRYFLLREAVEEVTTDLFSSYRSEVKCAKGCSECCDDISVLPIEWYLLREWFQENRAALDRIIRPRFYGENRCPFLHKADESCSIYPIRPIICRVHGLPIRYTVEEYDINGQRVFHVPAEHSFAWCENNFIDYKVKEAAEILPSDGYIDMEVWNHSLRRLNSEFLAVVPDKELPKNVGWLTISSLVE